MNRVSILSMTLLFTAFLVSHTFAQGSVAIGMKGGLNLANISGKDVKNTDFRIGFAVGGFLTFNLNEQLAFQPEVYYTSKGYQAEIKGSDSGTNYRYSYSGNSSFALNYLEIPVLGVFSVNQNMKLFAGPYLDIYVNGKARSDYKEHSETFNTATNQWESEDYSGSDSEDIESDEVKIPGFGLIFGAEILSGPMSIGARYSMGLSNIPDDNEYKFRHQVIQFLVGFSIP